MTTNNKRTHSFTDDVLQDFDAVAIATLIKNKEIKPEEVIEASIQRAKKVEPKLNAVVTDCYEASLKSAARPNDGFFSGVPTFMKDLTAIEGMTNYFGTEAFAKAKPATKTDAIAKQIFAQGFVNLGMSSMPEFGLTCSTEFPANYHPNTCNPWNLKHSAGGSSGGSAALVAAGVVPIAHSADGGGSTRIPAACCGLIGLKPSRGRILKSGIFEQQIIEIAIDGVVTRSVRDTAYFYAEAEKYYKNPKLDAIGLVEGPSKRTYKIGFTGNSVAGMSADKEMMDNLHKAAALLESMGHKVRMVELPVKDQFVADFINLWGMTGFYTRHFGKLLFGKTFEPKKLSKLITGLSKHHVKNIFKTPFFLRRLRNSYHDYAKMFADFNVDFILTPTLAHSTPELGYLGMDMEYDEMFPRMTKWACFTPYSNTSGGPSISLPLEHDTKKDLPVGMMLWANHGQEKLLLDIAYQLEEAQPWKKITA